MSEQSTEVPEDWIVCPRCKGEGEVDMEWVDGRFVAASGSTCPLCNGAQGFEDEVALRRAQEQQRETTNEQVAFDAAAAFTDSMNPGLSVPEREAEIAALAADGIPQALQAAAPFLRKQGADQERQRLKEALTETGLMLQKWAREKRRQANDAVGPEKLKDEWVAKGYDNAADALFATLETDRG